MQEGLQQNVQNMETQYLDLFICEKFYFGFKDYRVFPVSHRLGGSQALVKFKKN